MPPRKRSPRPDDRIQRPSALRFYLFLSGIVLLAYCNCFDLGIAIDGHIVTGDGRVRAATLDNLRLIFTTNYWWPAVEGLYRPVTILSFLFNYAVLGQGTHAAGHHALNFLLHLANVCLFFAIVRRLFDSPWPAFCAAALWAIHPICSDTVANLGGRADLLASFGILGALVLYDRIAAAPGRSWPSCLALFAFALFAAFSKESGSVLLPLMLLSDLVRPGKPTAPPANRVPAYAAVAAALAVYWFTRFRVFEALPWPVPTFVDNPLHAAGFWTARWTAVKVLGMDLALLLWPAGLAADRSFHVIPLASFSDPAAWASFAVVAAVLAAAIVRRRRDPLLFWCAGFFGLALLPASNLVVVIGATMAERFLYLPAAAFALAVVALLWRVTSPRWLPVVVGALLALCAARTLVRNLNWNDDLTLMRHDSAIVPRSFRARDIYGEFLYGADPRRLDEAIRQVEAAWSILSPVPPEQSYDVVPASLGRMYALMGDRAGPAEAPLWYARSLDVLHRAVDIAKALEQRFEAAQSAHGRPPRPRKARPDVYMYLGITWSRLGRHTEAVAAYHEARDIDPTVAKPYDDAVAAWLAMKQPEMAALEELEKNLALGFTVQGLTDLAARYDALPGGSCAVDRSTGVPMLNTACPRLRSDLCRAVSEVRRSFLTARRPWSAPSYDCSASGRSETEPRP